MEDANPRAMSLSTVFSRHQPLTPVSPLLPTTLPHVVEPILLLPMTPPNSECQAISSSEVALRTGLHVLATERDALTHLLALYENDAVAQDGFTRAVDMIASTMHKGGKVVISGIGKSGKIGEKLVATMNSLEIRAAWLHPTEALHGDLGMIGPNDALLLLTFSGRTQELHLLLSHIPPHLPLLLLTSHQNPATCPLFAPPRLPHLNILLPAPIPIPERTTFGVPAPTSSTTAALALGDALALALAHRLHPNPLATFHAHHPGGAIGASSSAPSAVFAPVPTTTSTPDVNMHQPPSPTVSAPTMLDIAVSVADVPIATPTDPLRGTTALDVLLAAARSPSGWARVSETAIVAPRRVQQLGKTAAALERGVERLEAEGTAVERADWISVPGGSSVAEARAWVEGMRGGGRGRRFLHRGTVLGIVDAVGVVSGVVEIEAVVDLDDEEDGD